MAPAVQNGTRADRLSLKAARDVVTGIRGLRVHQPSA